MRAQSVEYTTELHSVFKRDEKTDHFVLNSFSQLVVQEIYFSSLILSQAREKKFIKDVKFTVKSSCVKKILSYND